MSRPVSRRRASAVGLASAALVIAPLASATQPAVAAPSDKGPQARYIVQVAGAPVASYTGGEAGLSPTKPAKGAKVKRDSAPAKAYTNYLRGKHAKVLSSVGASTKSIKRQYSVAFNGFTATLTADQARAIEKSPNVLRVWKDDVRTMDTTSTPKFLGMDGTTGVWQQQFGGIKKAGAGMIIGVIDSGIWPENPSFAPTSQTAAEAATVASKWKGKCEPGTSGAPVRCNNKLIGAQYFADAATVESFEFRSPRDYNGHGTHTASTSGGNNGVKATINGSNVGTMSGMAPQARISAYKALWATPDGRASGSTSDLVAAIDTAVGDGVDVINYSISGSSQFVVTADELAFLSAADAGVFVSTSAGNSGDTIGTSSVAHNSPWTMTVASSTHDRSAAKTVTLGNGQKYSGIGVGDGVGPKPIVNSSSIAAAGAPADAARLCLSDIDPNTAGAQPALDPAKAAGKIVVCVRGTNDRVDKSRAVKNAGGVGMVLANTSDAQSLDADFHAVPSIHVNAAAGAPIQAYANTAGATATISAVDAAAKVRAPEMSGFSSYGPAIAGGGDLLKPDITAPGSGVIAAVAPPGNNGEDFGSYSGTSMSAPHIAGIATLIKQKYPTWSPAAIKSSIMTTATTLDNTGQPIQRAGKNATPLDYGSGHVRPGLSFTPGLVYDAGYSDWLKYACGIGQLQLVTSAGTCDVVGSKDPSDLNYPSISVGDLPGRQTITRTVTNVESKATQYKADVQAPAGFTASVVPSTLTVPPGQSRSFTVTLTRTTAAYGTWSFGSLTWKGKRGQEVRSPISVRPVRAAAPTEVVSKSASGSEALKVTPGFTGTLTATAGGLVPSAVQTKNATTTADAVFQVTVPAGTKVARFALFDTDYAEGTDLDLRVTLGGRTLGTSGNATAEEAVTVNNPAAGTYTVSVDNYAGAASIPVKLHSFAVGDTATGNLTVTPASQAVTGGDPATVTASWTGLTAGQHYFGAVYFGDGTAEGARTLVTVNP